MTKHVQQTNYVKQVHGHGMADSRQSPIIAYCAQIKHEGGYYIAPLLDDPFTFFVEK